MSDKLDHCDHLTHSWCAACVKKLWQEKEAAKREVLLMRNREKKLLARDLRLREAFEDWMERAGEDINPVSVVSHGTGGGTRVVRSGNEMS